MGRARAMALLALSIAVPSESRPRSIVFRRVAPDAGGHHAVHIECMPNAGCTLFAEFLCSQLLARGEAVACFPDVFDCTTMVPKRLDETLPRGHHYVAKTKLWPIWCDYHGRETRPPDFNEPEHNVLREWRELGRTVNILFLRDPLQNLLSVRSKLFCPACGGMRARFAAADRLFKNVYEARDAASYWDAVLFAEDMADPEFLLGKLVELLGRAAVGTKSAGVSQFAQRGWHKYKSKPLAANNARLGYRWKGVVPANGTKIGRFENGGAAFRFGTGNAKLVTSPFKPFYLHKLRPATTSDQVLARAIAPNLAAAYEDTWPPPEQGVAVRLGGRTPTLAQTLAGALGQHTCHGCRKGACPRNLSAGVGPAPGLFGLPLPLRPRDLRTYYSTLVGPPVVPVQGHKSEALSADADGSRLEELLYALAPPLPGGF
ncbi:hypothetical protein T492DRAFT_1008216 [Pavlovales sp. CCMP2436]|nr:hypothetical protein T492DRAFT_1008216 [Pavlovales sp. CCMP2436]|mmetsp:Transcript_13395/g.34131  ORF Transcript_13395/g.34131 Transcript_13395/m.34131 type:complete len:431 (+) Transcript_13395:49-1341(+)